MQRRRRLRRVAIPSSQALSLLGRDLREAHLQVLLGGSGYRSSNANISNAATDPFLSSLILNFPSSEAEEISKSVVTSTEDTSAKSAAPTHMWKTRYCFLAPMHKLSTFHYCLLDLNINLSPSLSVSLSLLYLFFYDSFDPSLSHEEREKRIRQGAGRAGFVQDLFLSTLLID